MSRLFVGVLFGLMIAGALNAAVIPISVEHWPGSARPAAIVTLLLSLCAGVIAAQRSKSS